MKKKVYILLLVVVMMFSLIACKGEQSNEDVLRVGMELKWPPFEMTDNNGNADGVSVLIANELGKYLGKKVEIVDLSFGTLIPALETKKIDIIIGSMGITEERKQKIAFSDPYMYFKLITAVNKESGIDDIKTLFSKEGVRFVAPKSFSSLELAKAKANQPKIIEFDDKATASLELANGNADAFIVDAVTSVSIEKTYPDKIKVIYEPADVSPIGMGMRKEDKELKTKVNEFISKLDELGVNDKIQKEYDDILKEKVGKGYEFYLNEK